MTAKSAYTQLFSATGVAGNTEVGRRYFDVSSGDTIDFADSFTRVTRVAFMSRSRAVPSVSLLATTNIASKTILTLPTAPSLSGDDVDLLIIGPGTQTQP